MSRSSFTFVAVALSNAFETVASVPLSGAVIADASSPDGVRFVTGSVPATGSLAWGSYDAAAYNQTGWAYLDIHGNDTAGNDTLVAYAAGYLEGAFTTQQMFEYAYNTGALANNSNKLQKFLDDNWDWMVEQVAAFSGNDAYWAHVGLLLSQLQGLFAGQAAVSGSLTFQQVYNGIIQGGDIFNLQQVYGLSRAQAASPKGAARRLIAAGRARIEGDDGVLVGGSTGKLPGRTDHCSALIRLTSDRSDIIAGHTTWSGFESMGRILKRFELNFSDTSGGDPVPGRWTSLSSFPGALAYSSDDFYVMSSGLISIETTIDNDNITLAEQYASHKVVLEWARNVLSNRLASDGPSWASTFSRYASGTYTNSWMIVDNNKFTPGASSLLPGTFMVIEEMPGHMSVKDQSASLSSRGYWSSYNVPSDPFIFNISGQWALVEQYGGPTGPGAFFTLDNTSRALIFDRDAPTVEDDASMERMLRYNDFEHDPISVMGCGQDPPYSAVNAIAARADLNKKKGDYVIPDVGHGDLGGIDGKYTRLSWMRAANLQNGSLPLAAISGPTYDQQPPFTFSNSSVRVDHLGYPDVWMFPWIQQPW